MNYAWARLGKAERARRKASRAERVSYGVISFNPLELRSNCDVNDQVSTSGVDD